MKIKTYEDFEKLIAPMHKANRQTMELLVTLDWFQMHVKKARKTAGWPIKGYKVGDKKLEKEENGMIRFLPTCNLEQDYAKHRQYNQIIDEIIKREGLPEHFRFHIHAYILFNLVNAPATNFIISEGVDWKKGTIDFPSIKYFSQPYTNDKKLANHEIEQSSKKYSPLQSKTFRYKPELEQYLKTTQRSKKIKAKKYKDTTTAYEDIHKSAPDYTDRDVAVSAFKVSSEESVARKTELVRKHRERLHKAFKERGLK